MLKRLRRTISQRRKASLASVSVDSLASDSSNPDIISPTSGEDFSNVVGLRYDQTAAQQQPQLQLQPQPQAQPQPQPQAHALGPPLQSCAPSPQPSRDALSDGHGSDSTPVSREVSSPGPSAWRTVEGSSSEGLQRFVILQEVGRYYAARSLLVLCTAVVWLLVLHDDATRADASCLRGCNRGSSGTVCLAVEAETGRRVAIKQIPVRPRFKADAVLRELANQRLCRGHPNIIQLEACCLQVPPLLPCRSRRIGGSCCL